MARTFGLGRGKVFPAAKARSLLSPLRRIVQSPRRAVDRMGLDDDARALEIGCGPGYFSPELARAVRRGLVVLLDLQLEMLHIAHNRLAHVANAVYTQADATHLPFRAESFDAVLVVLMLGEVPDQGACLSEIRRVLRQDGVLTIAETRRDSDFIALPALRTLVEPLGFRFIDRRGMRWEYTARFARV
ncbi:MAG: methyltransferase domain-containing protein [Acidimicrobiales bacterium]